MKQRNDKTGEKTGAKDISTRETLDTGEGLTAFCDAIIRERGVLRACNALGVDRGQVWLYLAKHPEAQAAVWQARQEAAHALFDECCEIADNAKREDWAIARLRIETRMRAAGKLNQRAYGDQPRNLTQTYVQGDVQIIATEEQRRAMIEARQKFLDKGKTGTGRDTGRHSLGAPSASPGVVTPQPEDPHTIHMRSFENGATEDQARLGTVDCADCSLNST